MLLIHMAKLKGELGNGFTRDSYQMCELILLQG